MGASYQLYVLGLLLSATLALLGCGRGEFSAATMPSTAQAVSLTVEPAAIAPTFVAGASCLTRPPFDLRFVVRLAGPTNVFFHRVRFRFEDRFGRVEIPRVALAAGSSVSPAVTPNLGPVPIPSGSVLPNSSPIPMPSATTLPGMVTSFGDARQLPLSLQFDCGVAPAGTLIVVVDFDDHGRPLSSEARVNVR
jgi:hypothetical protein